MLHAFSEGEDAVVELRQPRSLGVYVDAAETDEIPADVLLGEDGSPRGVRLSEAVDF
jgi:hypothetical protein